MRELTNTHTKKKFSLVGTGWASMMSPENLSTFRLVRLSTTEKVLSMKQENQ